MASTKHYYVAFLSHKQDEFNDRCGAITDELWIRTRLRAWFDQRQDIRTADTMIKGVRESGCFVLCASDGYAKSGYCVLEVIEALTQNKPIALLHDERAVRAKSITVEKIPDFIEKLISAIRSHNKCTSQVRDLTGEEIQSRLCENVLTFHVKRGSAKRDDMLRKIIALGGAGEVAIGSDLLDEVENNPSCADIFIVGHSTLAVDQCELIALGLEDIGARTMVLDPTNYKDALESVSFSSSFKGLIVFLTNKVFEEDLIVSSLKTVKQSGKVVLGVFETDLRKEGALLDFTNELKRQANDDSELLNFLGQDHIRFSQYDRNDEEFKLYIKKVGQRLGFISVFQDIDTTSSLWAAGAKAAEFEEGTREWLMDAATEFCKTKPSCILISEAGMGKSCIMGALAKRHYSIMARGSSSVANMAKMNVGAVHFFRYSNDIERKIETCVQSIAKQLCASVPGFRSCLPIAQTDSGKDPIVEGINKCLKEANMIPNPTDRAVKLFRDLIIHPSRKVDRSHSDKVVILIDALDESEDSDAITRTIQKLWAVSFDEISSDQAPFWLVLMASTRPQSVALERFEAFEKVRLEPTAEQNREDLYLFIKKRMSQWNIKDEDALTKAIVEQSEGVFLWLSYQEQNLKGLADKGQLTLDSIQTLPKGLGNVYKDFFSRIKTELAKLEPTDPRLQNLYETTLVMALLTPRSPLPEEIWKACLGLDDGRKDTVLYDKIKCELSKLLIFDSSMGVLRAPHKTMIDFIDWTFSSSNGTSTFDERELKLEVQPQHHALLGQTMCKWLPMIQKREFARSTNYSFNPYSVTDQYVLTNVVHHLIMGGDLEEASRWYLEMSRLIRLADGASLAGQVMRIILDGEVLLDKVDHQIVDLNNMEKPSKNLENKTEKKFKVRFPWPFFRKALQKYPVPSTPTTKLRLCLQFLNLAIAAIGVDARMLPSQVLGRLGFPPWNDDRAHFEREATAWLDTWKANGGCAIAEPLHYSWSGLLPAGTSLMRTYEFDNMVGSVAIGRNGEICVAYGKEVVVIDERTGSLLKKLEGHSDFFVYSVAISSDSKCIVTGSWDKTARLWDLHSGQPVRVLEGHSEMVTSVAISSDSKWIMTGSWDNTARLWDLQSGQQIRVLEGHSMSVNSVAISSDSKWIVTGSSDITARLWDLQSGQQIRVLEGHSMSVNSVAISSDSKWIVTGSSNITARLWDLQSGQQIRVLEGHSLNLNSVAISSDSKWIVTGSQDNTARLWDLQSGQQVRVLEGHSSVVNSVAISSDSKWIVTGSDDKTARLWDLHNGQEVRVLEGHSIFVESIAISSDSKWIVTGSEDNTARLWDLQSGQQIRVLEGHSRKVTLVAISSDSKWIVTGSHKTARLWDLHSGQQVRVLEGHSFWVTSVAISSASKWIVTGSDDKTARLWDLRSGQQVKILEGHSKAVKSVAISSDSKWIVTGSSDNTARLWDLHSGQQVKVLEGHSFWVTSVAISSDSKWILTNAQKEVFVWELHNGRKLDDQEANSIMATFTEAVYAPRNENYIFGDRIENDCGFVVDSSFDHLMRKGNLVFGCTRHNNAPFVWKLV